MLNLSIVTGTYNRLPYLMQMMDSVRLTLPISLLYEFVVVDGGSTDGTLDYLREQANVRLIEHGNLRGAIPAFCEGAKAAQGEYVILANDDITFTDNSIVKAFIYLETHPKTGAVAFMDNRPAPGYGTTFKVQTISAIYNGQLTAVPYPQVGMIRRWLGDKCLWWGADDPIMGQGHTYGGDSYLGARIWEHGYTVDAVTGVTCEDHIPQDDLRQHNHHMEQRKPGMYYQRYKTPPVIKTEPVLDNPQTERLRILYLPIFEAQNDIQHRNKRGLKEALQRIGIIYELDYMNVPFHLEALVEIIQPHLLLMQLHGHKEISADMIAAARDKKPDMVVVNWNGDARYLDNPDYLNLLTAVDLQLVVNAAPLPLYKKQGIKADYWQIGYELPLGDLPDMPSHDVVFLGNCYNSERHSLEKALASTGLDIGLYGDGWKNVSGNTLYDFAAGEALYHKATIAIGDTFPDTKAFVSNRLFQALGAGAFLLQQRSELLTNFTGLRKDEHYVEWTNHADLLRKIALWSSPAYASRRREIAACGQEFVRTHYSFDAQVQKLFRDLLPLIGEKQHVGN